ncbi:acyltransferase [Pseudomonas sp. 14P_8.1_Bac3]|uniref:acyltransferase family protein n=1 Tax=Pseudomonas sp. 14P_8.1_Bac3 TaxID=2971621 RepID=UPI0021C5A2B0|nr:acyltransferase family protein [Pseudomonas sp. 14P_8.1_Bac3]MCU1758376.1 acyltransferase [Pseudomonas sp. 14P_8.1_Bac3]
MKNDSLTKVGSRPGVQVSPGATSSLAYRADIDGLRAVAVLLVLIFHGGLSLFPSGFIGVDIFFVISGYLTTSIILKSIEKNSFTFAGFYSRRIWRLQPAMIALMLVTLALAAFFYLPQDFIQFLKSERYTSLFLSNQYFERSTTAYAADDTSSLLLLHTWSLAIEWQWYLVLPLGVWLLRRYCPPTAFKAVVLCLTLGATALSLYLSSKFPDKSYYFFTARIFELLIGSCAVIFSADKLKLNSIWNHILGVAAVIALFYCATREQILLGFPDYHAVVVCLATALLLWRNGSEASMTAKVLSFPPLVYIGTISYSLYIWHWPVLATSSYLGFKHSTALTVAYFVLTFALAALSYVTIERKFRKPKLGLKMTLGLLIGLPAIALSALYSLSVSKGGWPQRFGSDMAEVFDKLQAMTPPARSECLGGASKDADTRCVLGAPHAKAQALLMGDSFSNQYWGFVDTLAKDANISVLARSYSACLALPDIYLYDWSKSKGAVYKKCHDNVASYYELIKKNHYKFVLIGQIWDSYADASILTRPEDPRGPELSHQRFEFAIRHALNAIEASGAVPIFLKAMYPMPPGVNECLLQRYVMRGQLGSIERSESCKTVAREDLENPWINSVFAQLKVEYPNLVLIDPKDIQCDGGACETTVDGIPLYRDIGHMTDYASYKFGETYLSRFGNPMRVAQ